MDSNERTTSSDSIPQAASRTTSRVATRDYAGDPISRSTSQVAPRSRYADFNFGVSSLRHRPSNLERRSIMATSPSPGPTHGWRHFDTMSTRRSVAIAAPSAHGDFADTASRKFSMAGPAPSDTVAANQCYVDPGYAKLNPAYDQPVNVRPVWGLAKPLPRVLRPGMVPTKDELNQEALEDVEAPPTVDLEAGRIEPSLRPDKAASTLETIRREREIALVRAFEHPDSPGLSPYTAVRHRASSDVPTVTPSLRVRHEEPIEEEVSERSGSIHPHYDPPELSLPEAVAGLKAAKEETAEVKPPYEDAVPLLAYEAEDDEIHNLHTYWSIIRLRFREPLAELLGITVQYTLGFSANLSMTVSRGAAGANDTGTWAWGLSTMLAIYIAGGISGAHLNPAISLMLYVYRGFPLNKLPSYIGAQMLGAVLATLISFGLFQPGLIALLHSEQNNVLHSMVVQASAPIHVAAGITLPPSHTLTVLSNFLTFPRTPWVSFPLAFATEMTATAVLVISVLALGDDTNAPPGAGMNAFIVGLLITILGMAFGSLTGLAMNPIRDFGPRVTMLMLGYGTPKSLFGDGYWFKVAWLGPIVGAILGGFLYDGAIFVGGESPVNYPSRRLRRAARKWRKRWRVRMGWTGRVKTARGQK